MSSNAVPTLLSVLRPTLREIAQWAGVSRGLANFWVGGAFQPKPQARARLVKAVRRHAERLLGLADHVEREGKEQPQQERNRRRQRKV